MMGIPKELVLATILEYHSKMYVLYMKANKYEKKSSKDLTQHQRDGSGPWADPSTVHWSVTRNGLSARVDVKTGISHVLSKI